MDKKIKILVAVIAYNEAENIKNVFVDLENNSTIEADVVIIDNASIDNTVAVCEEKNYNVVSHCVNTGGGWGTFKSYMLYAYHNDYDIICQFDGDAQHDASYLKTIVEPVIKNEADLVIGSRFIEKEGFQSLFFRRIGINLFSFLNSLIIKKKITDATSGFRAYNRKVIGFFAKLYKHELFDPNQLLILSSFAGARILEVPVKMKPRIHGESEFNISRSISFIFSGLVNILGSALQKKEIKNMMVKNGY